MQNSPLQEALGIDLPIIEVLDVGAMAEGQDRYAGLVAQGLARVTGFEPDPEQFQLLTRDRPSAGRCCNTGPWNGHLGGRR